MYERYKYQRTIYFIIKYHFRAIVFVILMCNRTNRYNNNITMPKPTGTLQSGIPYRHIPHGHNKQNTCLQITKKKIDLHRVRQFYI